MASWSCYLHKLLIIIINLSSCNCLFSSNSDMQTSSSMKLKTIHICKVSLQDGRILSPAALKYIKVNFMVTNSSPVL